MLARECAQTHTQLTGTAAPPQKLGTQCYSSTALALFQGHHWLHTELKASLGYVKTPKKESKDQRV